MFGHTENQMSFRQSIISLQRSFYVKFLLKSRGPFIDWFNDVCCLRLFFSTGFAVKKRKKANILFNDALNTFYLRLYGFRHMVKDHSDRIAHTTAFVTPVMELWLEREIAQWVHPMKDRSDDPSHHE